MKKFLSGLAMHHAGAPVPLEGEMKSTYGGALPTGQSASLQRRGLFPYARYLPAARQLRGAVAACLGLMLLALPSVAPARAADDDWPTYHHSADRSGVGGAGMTFSDVQPTWTTAGLDGAVYAEPLYVGGRV